MATVVGHAYTGNIGTYSEKPTNSDGYVSVGARTPYIQETGHGVSSSSSSSSGGGVSTLPSTLSSALGLGGATVRSSSGNALSGILDSMVSGLGSSYMDAVRESMQIAQGNSAQSQAFAREQMDFQRESDRIAMDWSAKEAQKTRDWQENLANTAHQRETQDLIKAGLNPVLSANGGAVTPSGSTGQAYTSSGAMGSVDTTNPIALFGTIFNGVLNSAMQLKAIDAEMSMQEKQIASNERISHMNNEASITGHQISSAATQAAAAASAAAMRYSADQSYAGSKYASDKNYENQHYSADKSSSATRYSADTAAHKTSSTYNDIQAFGNIISKAWDAITNPFDAISGAAPYGGSSKGF